MERSSGTSPARQPDARRLSRACAAVTMLAAIFTQPALAGGDAVQPSAARRAELITLVRQDCGSCHGLTLKGGLGPSLLPDALRGKPADSLTAVILHGRPGTPMPPWQRFLNEEESGWIVANLQKGFPDGR